MNKKMNRLWLKTLLVRYLVVVALSPGLRRH